MYTYKQLFIAVVQYTDAGNWSVQSNS